MVSLTIALNVGSRKNLTMSPNVGMVLSSMPDTPLSFETRKESYFVG